MTNVSTDETGLFTAVIPVPADATLGPVVLETQFNGTSFYLPSASNGTWTIYSKILVDVSVPSPLAVTDTVTITGTVLDNQLQPIAGHVVELKVDGFVLTQVTTGADGSFSYDWTVQDFFDFGDNLLEADVIAQGYYREGSANQSFFLSHRSAVTIEFVDGVDATRGDFWSISGRLFDIDTVDQDGIANQDVLVYLDGVLMTTVTTDSEGEYSATVLAGMDLARGSGHSIEVIFEGTQEHLSASSNGSVTVWADILITIDGTSTETSVRSDIANPIRLTGSVSEVGGIGEVFENIVFTSVIVQTASMGSKQRSASVVSRKNGALVISPSLQRRQLHCNLDLSTSVLMSLEILLFTSMEHHVLIHCTSRSMLRSLHQSIRLSKIKMKRWMAQCRLLLSIPLKDCPVLRLNSISMMEMVLNSAIPRL